MTITETPGPRRAGPAALARGFLTAVVVGASLAAVAVGIVVRDAALWCAGGGLFALTVAAMTVVARRKRARTPPPEKQRALAMIESRRATSAEGADVPIAFVLTVAPDGGAAYRVRFTQRINLVDVPDYRPRGIVVVEYPADRPWAARIIAEPDAAWAARAVEARLDSAPESTEVAEPSPPASCCLTGVAGVLIGAAIVVLSFRAELFHDEDGNGARVGAPAASTSTTSSSSSSSSSTTTARTSESMLLPTQMRRTADALIATHSPYAVAFSVEEHVMSVRGVGPGETAGTPPRIDLRTLPYDRLPGLVREARTTSGVGDTGAWRVAAEHDPRSGALLLRVTVSDDHGSGFLVADAQGRVTGHGG
ncbi:hypothetical protein ABZ721_28140 [Streptomyces sp. NPDC006733]|uniref:hypothetical protein n=1 Tax=Streptomyces sp. NPDC006733 TaxID=3155460 RepID=UPI0033C20FE3